MGNQTAIEQAIEFVKGQRESGEGDLRTTILVLKELLAIEKQQIVDAYNKGFQDGWESDTFHNTFTDGNQYFESTFKTKEKK